MKKTTQRKLVDDGWCIGNTQDFLGLSDTEAALMKLRVRLARELKRRRMAKKVSQARFAMVIGSSQSRVAKMEAGDPSVSLDLLLRSLISSGTTAKEIGRVIAGSA